MQQIRLELCDRPSIYRIIHIDETQMLIELEFVILASFDLIGFFEEQEAFFTSHCRRGIQADQYILMEIAEKERIQDWLVTQNDELTYFLGDDELKVRIVLEQQVVDELGLAAICIDGQGTIASPKKKKLDLTTINTNLNLEQLLSELNIDEMAQLVDPDFEELLKLSATLNKAKPWQYFNNEEIIAIQLEEFNETFYVVVMGAGNQEFGLLVYDEEIGYRSLAHLLAGKPLSMDFQFELSALSVNFVDRAKLDKADYQLIKDCGMSFRGKNNWHQFRMYTPGMMPMIPTHIEVEVLKLIIQAMLQIMQLRIDGWQYPDVPAHTFPTFTVSTDGELSSVFLRQAEQLAAGTIQIDMNDIERAQYKRKPKVQLQLEFDLFYLPFASPADEEMNLFIFPTVCVVFDRDTGEVIYYEVLPIPKQPITQQELFWHMLLQMPVRPSKVFVSKEMHEAVAQVAKKAGVELVVSELPNIQHFRQFMLENPPID